MKKYFKLLILIIICVLTIITLNANADCTLQLHAYDYEGQGWGDSTVTVRAGKHVVLDKWTMSELYYEMVEFTYEGDFLDLKYILEGESSGYATTVISNDQGNPIFVHRPYYSRNRTKTELITEEITCAQVNLTMISKWYYAQADQEPGCYDGYEDEFNGGCGSEVEAFTRIQCGDTVLGTVSQFHKGVIDVNDEDWYILHLSENTWIDIQPFAEMPIILELYTYSTCQEFELHDSYKTGVGYGHSESHYLPAGDYVFRVIPQPEYAFPCNNGLQYAFSVLCSGLPVEEACFWENEEECEEGFAGAANNICRSLDDTVSELKLSCINGGSTGNSWNDGAITPDFDWYSFHLWEEQDIQLTAESMCSSTMTLFLGDCGEHFALDSLDVEPFVANSIAFDSMIPGEYLLLVEPRGHAGVYCGSEYNVLLDAGYHGNSVNTADSLYSYRLFNRYRSCSSSGDLCFADNLYNAQNYGCGNNLDTPETVHRLIVPERITVNFDVEGEGWTPRVIVTREWPPEDCLLGSSEGVTPFSVHIPKTILEPDTVYFIFIEGESDRVGRYELTVSRIDPSSDQMTVELELNQDRFLAGDTVQLLGRYSNFTIDSDLVKIGLVLEILGEHWVYDSNKEWTPSPESFASDFVSAGETVEKMFIDATWPASPFLNTLGTFTFYLFDFGDDSDVPYIKSNIVTKEFLF